MKAAKRHKSKKSKLVEKSKPVNPTSRYGQFRNWVIELEQRQENDRPLVVVSENESHVCKHCGTAFTGSYCPECSMPARWQRFNWKLLMLNFMDIWGLGNRPMFRTIRDLFWRPGYMIKDYLHGHHLSYFPPFKMLAVWSVIMVFFIWIITSVIGDGTQEANDTVEVINNNYSRLSSLSRMILDMIKNVFGYLEDHILYRIIVQNVLVVVAVKWAFHKISSFNYVETFISQIYINSQFLILALVIMLFTWRIPEVGNLFPYMMSESRLLPLLVLTYDFHQLYGISWKKAFWKTIVVGINMAILFMILILLLMGTTTIIEHFLNPGYELL